MSGGSQPEGVNSALPVWSHSEVQAREAARRVEMAWELEKWVRGLKAAVNSLRVREDQVPGMERHALSANKWLCIKYVAGGQGRIWGDKHNQMKGV